MPSPKVASSSPSAGMESPSSSTQQQQQPPPAQSTHHKSIDPKSSFLAGIAGGASSTILLYPLDLVKVRMQVDERNNSRHKIDSRSPQTSASIQSSAATNKTTTTTKYPRTICSTVRGVIQHEGYHGLYRGLTPALIGSAASWGGFFIIYEELKLQMLQRKRYKLLLQQQQQRQQQQLSSTPTTTTTVSNRQSTDNDNNGQYIMSNDMHVDEEIDINTNNTSSSSTMVVTLGPTEHFTASCLAGACMVALTNPVWLIKTRLQLQNSKLHQQLTSSSSSSVQQQLQQQSKKTKKQQQQVVKPPYRGLFHAAYTIVKEEGILALYKGSIPALMLVSHGGIQFVSYEFLKGHFANFVNGMKRSNNNDGDDGDDSKKKEQQQYWNKKGTKATTSISERLRDSLGYLVMGAASKFIASTTTYPLQVIKARLQQRSQTIEFSEATGEIIVVKREYLGVVDCIGKIWRNEGILGFFKGCVTNALRVAPSAAITFVTYEFVLDVLTTGEESK